VRCCIGLCSSFLHVWAPFFLVVNAYKALMVCNLCRFNELRKVRNKPKAAGTERPFSRMYNFYALEQGDKWAKTGTRFKPRTAAAYPRPGTVMKSVEIKKERAIKSSPAIAPQWSAKAPAPPAARVALSTGTPFSMRAPEPKRHTHATPKTTPHAIRPIGGGHNVHILGNRSSPPPDKQGARYLHDNDMAMTTERLHQLQGKRRCYEDMSMDIGAPQPLDLPSARRLRTVEPGAHEAAYMHSSVASYYSHSHSHSRYHHHSSTPVGQDEQSYLYRMRPEVREEVMTALMHPHGLSGRPLSAHSLHYVNESVSMCSESASASARRIQILDAMQHRETHLPAYKEPLCYKSVTSMHSPYGLQPPQQYEHHDQHHSTWSAPAHAPVEATHAAILEAPTMKAEPSEHGDDETFDDVDDGFSSAWSTPDTIHSICQDFVGSPLDLGESDCLSALLDGPAMTVTESTDSRKGATNGLVVDDTQDTPWCIQQFAAGTSW